MRFVEMLLYPFRREPRRPLAARRPDRAEMGQDRGVPLGMEATDMSLVDQVSRKNDALERANVSRPGAYAAQSNLHVAAMPEDETYAARFHRAFQKKGSET